MAPLRPNCCVQFACTLAETSIAAAPGTWYGVSMLTTSASMQMHVQSKGCVTWASHHLVSGRKARGLVMIMMMMIRMIRILLGVVVVGVELVTEATAWRGE